MLSAGIFTDLASAMIVRSRGLVSASPPPPRAATVNSLMMRVNTLPRLASAAPFLCLMVCHLEWPDMLENPQKTVKNCGLMLSRLLLPREDHPYVRPRIPGAAAIVAEHRPGLESGLVEPLR